MYSIDNKKIGEKIQKYRIKNNKTQAKLAEEIDITSAYLGLIERGQREASPKTLKKLAENFDIPYISLICDMDEDNELYAFWEMKTKDWRPEIKKIIADIIKLFLTLINYILRGKDQ